MVSPEKIRDIFIDGVIWLGVGKNSTMRMLENCLFLGNNTVPSAALSWGCKHVALPCLTFWYGIERSYNILWRSNQAFVAVL